MVSADIVRWLKQRSRYETNDSIFFIDILRNSRSVDRVKNKLTVSIAEGARGVMVIVVGNGHGDTSSNPGRD